MATETLPQAGKDLKQLVAIMSVLREKCPWDQEQTYLSLKPYVIEETYEVLEAIDSGKTDKLQEELGDLLLQVVFLAQLATEEKKFTMDDVIEGICEKLIRRHPHVFGTTQVNSTNDVLNNWDKIKQTEKSGERPSVIDGIPKDLPALMYAEKLQHKAGKVGFDWGDLEGPLSKTKEEFAEFEEVLGSQTIIQGNDLMKERLSDEFGDILFSLVNVGRFLDINPEIALRGTSQKFTERFHYMEQEASKAGKSLKEMTLEEMEHLWEQAKSL
ncbi:MAG TPA: nucleoside triphosphate pyrophosphohydrolase [Firmicutes bacterium]|jgi:tetrapyrrole methylase family protein / MazG family protein|nr:nucleoside triphosphate pyrophosphohydrolase [Bacillota bacterium]